MTSAIRAVPAAATDQCRYTTMPPVSGLLNLSNWGSNGRIISVGIGNRPGTSNIEWTHAQNAASYVRRTMHILAQTTPKAAPPLPAEVAANVPSASGYELLYTIDLPSSGADFYNNSASYYSVNNLDTISDKFTRIAYYLELVPNTGTSTNYIWTSMDAFTSNAARIGVPTNGTYFRMYISNLEVKSNVAGISNGNNIATGNIEFWPSNYGDDNAYGIPNASSDLFDFGDSGGNTGNGYGSMQVHNYGASQTLFAFNNFNNGIKHRVLVSATGRSSNPDWTFAKQCRQLHSPPHARIRPARWRW